MKINKKGELATQHIVILIVMIVSFAIILFFLARLNLSEETEKEICHNSVVARGSSVLPEESIPLKCQRSYVCITADNTCEQMTNPDKKKVKTQDGVYEVLAEEMADCWWMFGEGKINYVGADLIPELYCSICAQIAFDDSLQEEIFTDGKIEEEEFYEYLSENNVLGKDETYLEYLYETKNLASIKTLLADQGVDFGSLNLNNQQYVMMGITSDVSKLTWIGVAAGAVATIAFLPFAPLAGGAWGASIGALTLYGGSGAVAGTAAGFIVEGTSGNHYLSPSIIEVNSEEFKGLGCKSITTLA